MDTNTPQLDVVAFSLYGADTRYCTGAVENARHMTSFYPGWRMHVWVDEDVPPPTILALLELDVVIHQPPLATPNRMFWRFLVHDLPGVERYVVRDVDSRFSWREVKAVLEWTRSGRQLHVMRDHPFHSQAIMGGMWGWRKEAGDIHMAATLAPWVNEVRYGRDQEFLRSVVWDKRPSRLVHDSCGTFDGIRNWPWSGPGFVGEYVEADGRVNAAHRRMRAAHLGVEWRVGPLAGREAAAT